MPRVVGMTDRGEEIPTEICDQCRSCGIAGMNYCTGCGRRVRWPCEKCYPRGWKDVGMAAVQLVCIGERFSGSCGHPAVRPDK